VESTDRLERLLLALVLQSMKHNKMSEKIEVLSKAGFSPVEIANLLDIRAHNVSQVLYDTRKSQLRKVVKK
jgi:CRP-like cAMP-binding protein